MTTASASRTNTDVSLPGVLAGLAVRVGRTLEVWGRRHASRLNDRERMLRTLHDQRMAQAALDERDALIRSSTFLPLG
ncbi:MULTISPECIES: hypothetical protein [unclassified Leifsonia]|uniref:hypothetical protein n=1 Tax=unclassified Leifsonia TaxID=2663824 RepID=UPI000700266B|nr:MULTISPECIES: hypothetical protein [unclassified Leifsonia]KQX06610.1 hypothetical protein ASC59_01750 [Leifsonia sp. Root1293]KRA10894.1 hypothetical protein ASD61_01750 [Leifsonia sp. Root60]